MTEEEALRKIIDWYRTDSGEAKRRAKGQKLSDHQDFANEIIAEERGEKIAWQMMSKIASDCLNLK